MPERSQVDVNNVLEITPGVVSREVDGDLVVVMPKRGEFVVLNPTGTLVYRLVDGVRSVREIARGVAEQHDVSFERALEDVSSFVEEMVERGAFSIRRS